MRTSSRASELIARFARMLLKVWRLTATLVFLLLLIIHFTPLIPWYALLLSGDWTDDEGDTLIVLGAEMERDGVLGPSSYLRSLYGVRAYRQHPYRAVVLSGGYQGGRLSLARTMRDFLAGNGVPAEVLFVEERSTSTRENALYTKALVEHWPGRKILLTSDYHTYRAARAFAKAGLTVTPRPFPDVLKRCNHLLGRWDCFWGLAVETVKIVYYRARGWI